MSSSSSSSMPAPQAVMTRVAEVEGVLVPNRHSTHYPLTETTVAELKKEVAVKKFDRLSHLIHYYATRKNGYVAYPEHIYSFLRLVARQVKHQQIAVDSGRKLASNCLKIHIFHTLPLRENVIFQCKDGQVRMNRTLLLLLNHSIKEQLLLSKKSDIYTLDFSTFTKESVRLLKQFYFYGSSFSFPMNTSLATCFSMIALAKKTGETVLLDQAIARSNRLLKEEETEKALQLLPQEQFESLAPIRKTYVERYLRELYPNSYRDRTAGDGFLLPRQILHLMEEKSALQVALKPLVKGLVIDNMKAMIVALFAYSKKSREQFEELVIEREITIDQLQQVLDLCPNVTKLSCVNIGPLQKVSEGSNYWSYWYTADSFVKFLQVIKRFPLLKEVHFSPPKDKAIKKARQFFGCVVTCELVRQLRESTVSFGPSCSFEFNLPINCKEPWFLQEPYEGNRDLFATVLGSTKALEKHHQYTPTPNSPQEDWLKFHAK